MLTGAVEGQADMGGEPCGEAVGPAGHGIGLVDDAGQPGEPGAEDHRGAGVAAHAHRDLCALAAQQLTDLQPGAQQIGREQEAAQP